MIDFEVTLILCIQVNIPLFFCGFRCSVIRKDDTEISVAREGQTEKQDGKKAAVIIIDDDEPEYVDVADMSCQANDKDIESETQVQREKEKDNTPSTSQNEKAPVQTQASHAAIAQNNLPVTCKPTPVMASTQQTNTLQTVTSLKPPPTISTPTDIVSSSVSTSGTNPPVIYRTLKSPVTSGAPLLPQRVALKSSPPSLPVQQSVTAVKPSPGNVSSILSPSEARYIV